MSPAGQKISLFHSAGSIGMKRPTGFSLDRFFIMGISMFQSAPNWRRKKYTIDFRFKSSIFIAIEMPIICAINESEIFVTIKSSQKIDAAKLCRYIHGTSLLFVSTAERGAVSLETALAFFVGSAEKEVSA